MTCESEFEGINLKTVSIVVPVYNEEDNLREFHKRITEVMSQELYDYKIVFVNDGSSDGSAVVLSELAKEDDHVEAFLLSRNYGHQMALTCGLDNAEGDAIVTMDGDMQHPPEIVPQLYAYGKRVMRLLLLNALLLKMQASLKILLPLLITSLSTQCPR